MRHRTGATKHAGFTLIELVIVMVIVGILAAMTLPRFAQASERQRLNVSAERVMADIALAQTRARTASQTVTITFDATGERYMINAVGGDAITVEIGQSPYSVDLVTASFDGLPTLQFNGFGVPVSTGQIQLSSNAGTVTISVLASGETKR